MVGMEETGHSYEQRKVLDKEKMEKWSKTKGGYYIGLYDSDNREYGYNLKPGGKASRGYKLSEAARANMSKAQKGKSRSASMKAKLSFPVLQYSLNGDFLNEFPSMMEAWRNTGVSYANISKCCQGKRKSAGKFCWKRKILKV